MVSTEEAIIDSDLNLETIDKSRVGVIWGSGIGGIETFQNEILNFAEGDGTPRFNPFFIPKMIGDIAPGYISMKYGFMGPNYTTVSACASSANALVDGDSDFTITDGVASGIHYELDNTDMADWNQAGVVLTTAGGIFQHHQTQAATYSVPASTGAVLAGPITITGTITNNGTMVVI